MAVLRFLSAWAGLVAVLALLRPEALHETPWSAAAESMRRGDLANVPPLWPFLTMSTAFIANIPVMVAGVWVSMVAAASVPVIATALARRLNVEWSAALLVGATAGAAVAPFAYDLAPQALLAHLLLLCVVTGLSWEERPDDGPQILTWLFIGLLASITHEVGLIAFWTAAIACVARTFPRTAVEIAAATCTVGALVVIGGTSHNLPARLAEPLVTSPWKAGNGPAPAWLDSAAELAWVQGNRLGVAPAFFERFLTLPHAAGWVVLAGAIGAVFAWTYARRKAYGDPSRPHPWALMAALSPALVAIVVWTRPPDLLVMVPVSAVGLGVFVAALGDWKEPLAKPAHALFVVALLATAAPAWWTARHDAPHQMASRP